MSARSGVRVHFISVFVNCIPPAGSWGAEGLRVANSKVAVWPRNRTKTRVCILRSCDYAAVHAEHHAGDERGLIAGEPDVGVRDIGGLAHASERRVGDGGLEDLFGDAFHHVRLDEAGRDGVDTDLEFAEF